MVSLVRYHSQKENTIFKHHFPKLLVSSSRVYYHSSYIACNIRIYSLSILTKRTSKHNWMTPKWTEIRIYARARGVCSLVSVCVRAGRRCNAWYDVPALTKLCLVVKRRDAWRRRTAQTSWRHSGHPLTSRECIDFESRAAKIHAEYILTAMV